MGRLTDKPFVESCCDGGECSTAQESARSCGCDPGENWICERHKEEMNKANQTTQQEAVKLASSYLSVSEALPFPGVEDGISRPIRTFSSGATRDQDLSKHDYEGFLSPLVIERFGEYMTKHRRQPDGSMRNSDNWQLGIPQDAYIKSAFRHFHDWWKQHRGYEGSDTLEDSICALIFNSMGYLHEVLRSKDGR